MDQDAFRHLLASSEVTYPILKTEFGSRNRGKKRDQKEEKPTFKPRNHKGEDTKRSHGKERQGGIVQQALEDFELEVYEERGKPEETELEVHAPVKGLDFALLEKEKAKLYSKQAEEDEALLEEAFTTTSKARKRTREEIIQELKSSRSAATSDKPLDAAKHSSKFRPIGAPPPTEGKKKRKKEGDKEVKKKKRKVDEKSIELTSNLGQPTCTTAADAVPPFSTSTFTPERKKSPEPTVDADADIFADAEEYRGLDSDSDSDGDSDEEATSRLAKMEHISQNLDTQRPKKNWFGENVEDSSAPAPTPAPAVQQPPQPVEPKGSEMDIEGKEEILPSRPPKLQGLASSAVPSIREILEMDQAAEKEEKRRARKEKKKQKNISEETKINREVKQLERYVASKGK